MKILQGTDISILVSKILSQRTDELQSAYIYDLNLLDSRLKDLRDNYPIDSIHAVAIKTNNLSGVLEHIVKEGHGLEAASFEEVLLAIDAGCELDKIVYDSPVKTKKEIKYCDQYISGIRINANSFRELQKLKNTKNINIGVRINPMVENNAPKMYNVSGRGSKFGIPIHCKDRLIHEILENNNIRGLHVHPGSEIQSLDQHTESIAKVVDLADQINERQENKIEWIDIGGGIKPEIKNGKQKSIDSFVCLLKNKCASLFDRYTIITEYGRFVHTHCAVAVSVVEDILEYDEHEKIALIHFGADLFLREVYSSNPPKHEFYILTDKGKIKEKDLETKYDIGGPLCFSGDFLTKNRLLPKIKIGDFIVIDACGANSISMWSSHCSRTKTEVIYVG